MNKELDVIGLTKIYYPSGWFYKNTAEPFIAVNGISFSVARGEVVGILGPNGAGKSTTMQMLLGTLTPTRGTIEFFGKNFDDHRSSILQYVGYASAYGRLPARLTVEENLLVYGQFYGLSTDDTYQSMYELLDYFDARALLKKQCGALSAGQATRIMLVKAFLAKPRIVLLDEPTASLDPDVAYSVCEFLLEQKKKHNVSIVLASHDMSEVSKVCDRVLVLNQGSIVASDTPLQLAATVSLARLKITIYEGLQAALDYIRSVGCTFKVNDRELEVYLEEKQISSILMELAQRSVLYTHIALEKPTLEDYFLRIAKKS